MRFDVLGRGVDATAISAEPKTADGRRAVVVEGLNPEVAACVGVGLGAAVYTTDVSRAMRMGAALRAGNVGINTWTLQPHAPFGGVN